MFQWPLRAAACAAALSLAPVPVLAQNIYPPPAVQQAQAATIGAPALDQLVSPVALYPDTLLAQILAASTYPLDIVQAHRWIAQPDNAALTGEALAQAVAAQGWDPSVQALVPFAQVLQLMDDHLNWTEQLGEAFLAQPQDVLSAVQRLRHRAQEAGSLKITPDQSVVNEGDDITIASAAGPDAYVPSYDPQCVYGPDGAAVPAGFDAAAEACGTASADALDYTPVYLPYGFFLWGAIDWGHHCIRIDRERYALAQPGRDLAGDEWHHDPAQRHGAPYRSRVNAARYAARPAAPEPYHYYAGFSAGQRPQARVAEFTPHPSPGPAARPMAHAAPVAAARESAPVMDMRGMAGARH